MRNWVNSTRLNDVFPNWFNGGGIFSVLQSFPIPWKNENISGALDLEYHGNVSGEKIISPLVEKLKVGDILTEVEKTVIATSIVAVCGVNWVKQWETLSLEYNPIENYHMVETMTNDETITEYGKSTTRTDNLTHRKTGTETGDIDETDTRTDNLTHGKTGTETRTDNLTHGKTGTETRTDNLTDVTTPNLTTNAANMVYGFNSLTGVTSGEQTGTETGTNTETHTGTEQKQYNLSETDTGTEQKQYNLSDTDTGTQATVRKGTDETTYNTTDTDTGTQTVLDGGSDTNTRNYELTRTGNIGVTTSQQMVESERSLWVWNFFRNVVFPDIDRVLTLSIY